MDVAGPKRRSFCLMARADYIPHCLLSDRGCLLLPGKFQERVLAFIGSGALSQFDCLSCIELPSQEGVGWY